MELPHCLVDNELPIFSQKVLAMSGALSGGTVFEQPLKLEQRHVEGAYLYASREIMMTSLKDRLHGSVIAEIGVAHGDFSRFLIDLCQPRQFWAFDIFTMHRLATAWGRPITELIGNGTHREHYERRFASEIAAGIVRIVEGDSSQMLIGAPDNYFDMIYVDGDHSPESVRKDVAAAIPKLKPQGILILNDYIMHDYLTNQAYGVVQEANRLCVKEGWKITNFALAANMFGDVALERDSRGS